VNQDGTPMNPPLEGFHILRVHRIEETLHATLPCQQLLGQGYRADLGHDFHQLTEMPGAIVRLDLRDLVLIDGYFPTLLIQLARPLADQGRKLTVYASPVLVEVLRITKLDHLMIVAGAMDSW